MNIYGDYFENNFEILSTKLNEKNSLLVEFKINLDNKKTVKYDACLFLIKKVLFDGIHNTRYSSPLLSSSEYDLRNKYPNYFNVLYNEKLYEFIGTYQMTSAFKKADKNKSTTFIIEINVPKLRRDLENNKIKKSIGL